MPNRFRFVNGSLWHHPCITNDNLSGDLALSREGGVGTTKALRSASIRAYMGWAKALETF